MATLIGYKGEELDLLVRQGATFGPHEVQVKDSLGNPVNITGAQIRAQIRKTPSSELAPGASAVFNITNAADGIFEFEFPWEQTINLIADNAGIDAPNSQYVWDMEMQINNRIIPLFYGKVFVFREVTKEV